mmetsp:Transcript_8471/g.9848  ORF Transcript_8471/g.9848 Transcript_8471/m.9848 type:complete len:154 (-) Transcript_8471:1199-1660(-)
MLQPTNPFTPTSTIYITPMSSPARPKSSNSTTPPNAPKKSHGNNRMRSTDQTIQYQSASDAEQDDDRFPISREMLSELQITETVFQTPVRPQQEPQMPPSQNVENRYMASPQGPSVDDAPSLPNLRRIGSPPRQPTYTMRLRPRPGDFPPGSR